MKKKLNSMPTVKVLLKNILKNKRRKKTVKMQGKTKGGNDHLENVANGIKGCPFVSNYGLPKDKAEQKLKKKE